jgi:single-stranded-DNA-specific exonuclease
VQVKLPSKVLAERPCNLSVRDAYLAAGAPAHVADLLGRRLDQFIDWNSLVAPRLSAIADPSAIPSIDRAVERIVRAIVARERIALACDHDMDGTASSAVLWTALVDHFAVPAELLTVVTSHRLTEGYGISEPVVTRIEDFRATLVISADKGSSDEARIALLAAKGIDVVVTDHHVIPHSGPPASAYAVVNPSRLDADYDRNVCGAGVAFLVMAKVRSALLEAGVFAQLPPLTPLLDFVAVATIADCVSLSPSASFTNRAFIRRGLELLRAGARPCWRVFAAEQNSDIDAETIAFRMVPAIAAAGRLDWAETGFRFLIAQSDDEAAQHWAELQRENTERKSIELRLRQQAFPQAAATEGPAIVLFLEDGHSGVHGITASRVVEAFGRPCAIFAPKGQGARSNSAQTRAALDPNAAPNTVADAAPNLAPDLASGSFRSVPGVDVQRALQQVALEHPDLLVAYGGHQAAAGATLRIPDIDRFRQAFCQTVAAQTATANPAQPATQNAGTPGHHPTLFTDGELETAAHTCDSLAALESVGPFGRGFEPALYSGTFRVTSADPLTNGRHGRLRLERNGLQLPAIWFDIASALDRFPTPGDQLHLAYKLTRNRFRDRVTLQAMIVAGTFQ